MKLGTRIIAGHLALIAVMAALTAHHLRSFERLQGWTAEKFDQLDARRAPLEKIADSLDKIDFKARKAEALRGDAKQEEHFAELATLQDEVTVALRAMATSPAINRTWTHWRECQGLLVPEVISRGAPDWGAQLKAALDQLDSALREAGEQLERESQDSRVAEANRRGQRAASVSWWALVLALVLAGVASATVLWSVVRPLGRLTRGTRALASGDLSYRVAPVGSPELAALAADFNTMADRLRELDRLKNDFVSNISHDLKAPLASMEETLALLLDGLPGPLTPKQERLLRLNLESAQRLKRMIENLLDLSRMEAGAVGALHVAPVDLAQLARRSITELAPLAAKKQLVVTLEATADTGAVECDSAAIRRAVDNLLSNAVAFSPPGGRIEVTVRPLARDSVEVTVADRGPGVMDAEKERIFQRFYRSDAGPGRGPGTGIGLAIARAVVEGHGGVLWVRDREGGGSVFSFLLPRHRALEPAAEAAS